MSYVERNLLPNEEINYRARLHRIIYLFPTCLFMAAVLVVRPEGLFPASSR